VTGAVLGAVWVIGLPSFFPGNDVVPLLTSSIGLLVLLMYFPGGLVQIGYSARTALIDWAERRLGPAPRKQRHVVPRRAEKRPLRASGVSVRCGGITAVDNVSLEVRDGEVVGLIGTNGAGKSTLMNAIGGFVPAVGSIELLGREAARSAATRARQGLGRS